MKERESSLDQQIKDSREIKVKASQTQLWTGPRSLKKLKTKERS